MPKTTTLGVLLRALAIVLIALGLLTAYAWGHKPLNIDYGLGVALRVGGTALDLLTAAVIALAAGGSGRALLGRLSWKGVSRAERIAIEGGVGLAALSTLMLVLGMIGAFQPLILWGATLAAALICYRGVRGWLADAGGILATGFHSESDTGAVWRRFCMVFVCVLLPLALFEALAPPQRWDSLAYQLVAPARYLEAGRIAPQADNFYLGFPQQVNLLFALAMSAFGRDTAAAPIHFVYGLFGLLATMGYARRAAGRVAGWTAALLLISAYNLWLLFGWSYTDLGAFMYGALALSAAAHWRSTQGRGWLILLGMIVGLAVGVKYTAGALALSAGAFALVFSTTSPPRPLSGTERERKIGGDSPSPVWRGGWGVRFANGILLALAAAVAYAPWALRGVLHYGNPVYPFAFGGLNWDALRAELFSFGERGLAATGQAWQAAFVPLSATVFGADKTDGFGFTAGAWLLTTFILLPFVWRWLHPRERGAAGETLVFLAPLIGVWMVTALGSSVGMQTRLMTMTLPAFALLGALALKGLSAFPKKPLDVNFILRTLLIASITLYALDAVRVLLDEGAPQVVLGITAPDDYLYRNTGAHYPALRQLETLPAGSQVRFMWEPRGYYCPAAITCRADVLFDHWLHPRLNGATPDQVFAQYRADGDDYLLVWRAGYDEYNDVFARYADVTATFDPALERYMRAVWTDGVRYTLYGWCES
ncbi:MAG: hypothetical protein SGI73_13415 [Chloroflexota bacterium]|nr:hypothetical protein [Chloroflexota bacterium]